MKKILLIAASVICVLLVKAEDTNEIIILQDGKAQSKLKIARNAKLDQVTDDSEKKAFSLKLGGINGKHGGYTYVNLPKKLAEFNADAIVIELKGDKKNSFAPVLLTGNNDKLYYCWKGNRSSWKARMPVFKNEWRKYTFYAKDFVAQQDPDKKLKNFNGSIWLKIAIGSTVKVYKKTITVMISSIKFKSNNKE